MKERIHQTALGAIHYWVNERVDPDKTSLVFLPGLTADHRLFDKQIACFKSRYNVLVWDAPGHAASWPFRFDFSMEDKAKWLHEILIKEHLSGPVLVGQSMGGYIAQMYAELFSDQIGGLIAIDSAPLQRRYITAAELWLLKRIEPVYRLYPWKALLKSGTNGVAVSDYGRELMHQMMMVYDGDQQRYARLSGHGFRMLAQAIEKDLPYKISCPAMLICGKQDKAGSCIRYTKAWHRQTGIPVAWIENAGHNANTDQPDAVNALIEKLASQIKNQSL